MEWLLAWLSQYGYIGLFILLLLGIVGLPVPDETLLIFSGYLIQDKRLHPWLTLFAAFSGSISGISVSYIIGRTVGHGAILRYGRFLRITPARLEQVGAWFQRTGEWLLAFGYFIPGVRHFTAVVAGMSGLGYRQFALFAYGGAAVWVSLFLGLGYLVGENWRAAASLVHKYSVVCLLLLIAAAGIAFWIRRRIRTATKSLDP